MEDLIIAIGIVVLIFIPALALTARFALKPIVEAIIRLREGFIGDAPGPLSAERIAAIEGELAEIRRDIGRLADVREFNRELTNTNDRSKQLADGFHASASSEEDLRRR